MWWARSFVNVVNDKYSNEQKNDKHDPINPSHPTSRPVVANLKQKKLGVNGIRMVEMYLFWVDSVFQKFGTVWIEKSFKHNCEWVLGDLKYDWETKQ